MVKGFNYLLAWLLSCVLISEIVQTGPKGFYEKLTTTLQGLYEAAKEATSLKGQQGAISVSIVPYTPTPQPAKKAPSRTDNFIVVENSKNPVLRIYEDGEIEFLVPGYRPSDYARDFIEAMKQTWPQICGGKNEASRLGNGR